MSGPQLLMLLLLLGAAAFLIWWILVRKHPQPLAPPPAPPGCSKKAILSTDLSLKQYSTYSVFVLTAQSSSEDRDRFEGAVQQMSKSNYGTNSNGQFSDTHYCFLVGPGSSIYQKVLPIGYYTQVMGVGKNRGDVSLKTVCLGDGGEALDTFWRAAENYKWAPMTKNEQMQYGNYPDQPFADQPSCTWAVSQACALRGCIVSAPMNYATFCPDTKDRAACLASGGYSADNIFQNSVLFASQQQWCSVNDVYPESQGIDVFNTAVWNAVFLNCKNLPSIPDGCTIRRSDNVQFAGLICSMTLDGKARRSKPFVTLKDGAELLEMIVPADVLSPDQTVGSGQDFWLACDERSLLDALAKPDETLRILVASETFIPISKSIEITRGSVVLLGLGLPLLRILKGGSLHVSGSDCIMAGFIIEAGDLLASSDTAPDPKSLSPSSCLLTWSGQHGWIYDLYTRVGGAVDASKCSCDAHLWFAPGASVTAENLWLWRADHDSQANTGCDPTSTGGSDANRSFYGLVLSQNASLTCMGLASEHHLKDNVSWAGEGQVFFYQSELAYCPPENFDSAGFTVESTGKIQGRGMGVYSYFPASDTNVTSGIRIPQNADSDAVDLDGCVTIWLKGKGGIKAVVNTSPPGCAVCKASNKSLWTKKLILPSPCPNCET